MNKIIRFFLFQVIAFFLFGSIATVKADSNTCDQNGDGIVNLIDLRTWRKECLPLPRTKLNNPLYNYHMGIAMDNLGKAMKSGSQDAESKLTASDGNGYDYFGRSVAISGDYAIVGAPYDNFYSGSAYIFERTENTWTQVQKITASGGNEYECFGDSVAISGDYAIVGASKDDDNGSDFGSAYIFERTGDTWTDVQKLTASDGEKEDNFGDSVAISGDYAIVGAPYDDFYSGSAYIFERTGDTWTEVQKLTASDGNRTDDLFGLSVGISGDYAIVGVPYDDDNGMSSGSAYFYQILETGDTSSITCDLDGNSVVTPRDMRQWLKDCLPRSPQSTNEQKYIEQTIYNLEQAISIEGN